MDNEDELRGIMADMLNIVSLQTGLQFDPILVRNRQALAKRMEKEDWAIMPAATLTPQPQAYVTLSDPLINVAFVLVARGSARPASAEALGADRPAGRAYRRP